MNISDQRVKNKNDIDANPNDNPKDENQRVEENGYRNIEPKLPR